MRWKKATYSIDLCKNYLSKHGTREKSFINIDSFWWNKNFKRSVCTLEFLWKYRKADKNPLPQFQKNPNKAAKAAHSCTTETPIPTSPAVGRETSSDDMANRHGNATGYRILWRWFPPQPQGGRVTAVLPCDWLEQSSAAGPAKSCGAAGTQENRVSTYDTGFKVRAWIYGDAKRKSLIFHFTHTSPM